MVGESPIIGVQVAGYESCCVLLQCKSGGNTLPINNSTMDLIANKYLEGKLKRTLERE